MPEGDSIYRLASSLAPLLEGRSVTALSARRLPDTLAGSLVGAVVANVTAKGKHLLIHFDDGRALHLHLGMQGRVFVERPRSPFWAKDRSIPDLRLVVTGASIVGRHLSILRLLTSAQERRAPELSGLGPDLARDDWDEASAVKRFRALSNRPIGDALLVQRAAAGIGNVYKSEVLFLERIEPRTLLSALSDDELLGILRRASTLIRRNLGSGPRTTRSSLGGPRLWVYGRGGRRCLRCDTSIVRFMQGPAPGRSTYYCPRCQPPRPSARQESRP
jgi:endonuclease-8